MVVRPDQWLWLGLAAVLMLTGAAGILFADTRRPVSVWALLGVELFAIFTAVPLLWTFTVATTPEGMTARTRVAEGDLVGHVRRRRCTLRSCGTPR